MYKLEGLEEVMKCLIRGQMDDAEEGMSIWSEEHPNGPFASFSKSQIDQMDATMNDHWQSRVTKQEWRSIVTWLAELRRLAADIARL
jgi:hypothetical protein